MYSKGCKTWMAKNLTSTPHFVYRGGRMERVQNNARRVAFRNNSEDPEVGLPIEDEIGLPIEDEVGLPIEDEPVDDEDEIWLPGEPIDDLPIDDFPVEILPIDDFPVEILPIDDFPVEILPIPDKEEPQEPEIPQSQKCNWGPTYYCQSEGVFSSCRSGGQDQFNSECKLIRDGMVAKCEDLGKRFWCSSQSNFNYCVASQGFTGEMSNFSACKPSRVGGRKNCKHCGRCITQIYNINSCACPPKNGK